MRSRRSRVLAASTVGVLLLILAVTASAGVAQTKYRSAPSPIVIGMVVNKTGWMSAFDEAPSNGVRLAISEINAKGGVNGRQIKLIDYDEKTKPALGASGASDLISKGASALVAACDFDFGSSTAVVAQQKKVPTLSTCAADPKFGPQAIGPYAYTMGLVSPVTGSAMAEWAYFNKHWRNVYVLEDRSIEYTKSLTKFFIQRFQELGGKVVAHDTFLQNDQSVQAQITHLKSLKTQPDFIVPTTYAPGLARVIHQMQAAGVKQPILGGDGFDGTWWTGSLPKLSNLYYVAYGYVFGPGGPTKDQWRLAKLYKAKFHKQPANAGFLAGYALVQVLTRAISEAGTTDGEAINNKLQRLARVPTVVGKLSFTPTLHNPGRRPVAVVRFVNGHPKFVTTWVPRKIPDPFKK